MTFPIWWKSHNPAMFQTTNQISIIITWKIWKSMGRIINYGQIKKKKNPNHQPEYVLYNYILIFILDITWPFISTSMCCWSKFFEVAHRSQQIPTKTQQRPTQRSPWRRREQKLAFPKSQVHALAKRISQCMDCDIWWYSPIFIPIYIHIYIYIYM